MNYQSKTKDILNKYLPHWMYYPNGDTTKDKIHDVDCAVCEIEDDIIQAMDEYASQQCALLKEENERLKTILSGKTFSDEVELLTKRNSELEQENERFNKEANHWMQEALRKSDELGKQKQRTAQLEEENATLKVSLNETLSDYSKQHVVALHSSKE